MDEETLAMAKEYTDEKQKELLEALPEDTTATGMEVADIRTGFDGTVYKTAGEAVREQVKFSANELKNISADTANILSAVGNYVVDNSVEIQNGYYDGTTFVPHGSYRSARIDATSGAHYSVDAFMLGERNGTLVSFYNAENKKISDTELESAKKSLKNAYMNIYDSPAGMELWTLNRGLSGNFDIPNGEAKKLDSVTKEQISEFANGITLDTVYFLKGEDDNG
jgi:hypothetical protein